MIGEVIFIGSNGYQEIVEAEAPGARLVECSSLATLPAYRLEYQENGQPQNSIFHEWPAAEVNFLLKSGVTV